MILLSFNWTLSAQTKYIMAPSPELKISGGSTLHDWDMTSNTAKGEGMFVLEGNQLKSIQNLSITMEAETLKSGTKGLDNNAYKALDTKKNKDVNANTEYSHAFPDNTKQFRARARTAYDVRYSWDSGKVATPIAPYSTLPAGLELYGDAVNFTSKTLYFATSTSGVIVEMEMFT